MTRVFWFFPSHLGKGLTKFNAQVGFEPTSGLPILLHQWWLWRSVDEFQALAMRCEEPYVQKWLHKGFDPFLVHSASQPNCSGHLLYICTLFYIHRWLGSRICHKPSSSLTCSSLHRSSSTYVDSYYVKNYSSAWLLCYT